ncbi:MAG TPA: SDR family oxidoreductase [Mesorhizobium sp.]|jgi:NAD(P)-dependent dehydrogenase (short-subunit alcohol dehydrogenase family)|nr:SDR family oxidoreductase [Mesorhizobium sp.]
MADGQGVALVTGAGTGIGRAAARALHQAGWRVVLVGRREAPLRETAQDLDRVLVVPADVTDASDVDDAFARAAEEFGRVDLLFNNAGASLPSTLPDEVSPDDWNRIVAVNLTGAFLCARAAFRQMRTQNPQGGRIINNGSVSAHAPRPGSIAYTATKHAVTGLTKSLALDGRPFSIACGQIDIGNALTEMAAPMTRGVPQADGRFAIEPTMDVARVAEAVVFMAGLPLDANVLTMTVMATNMPFVGRG